jgi:hypothetical protein
MEGEAISGAAGVARVARLILGKGVSEDRTSALFGLRSPVSNIVVTWSSERQ